MTNKQERFLVMSEAEFEAALYLRSELSIAPGYVAMKIRALYDKAEAACRARPVPEWATHFAELTTSVLSKWERIKK